MRILGLVTRTHDSGLALLEDGVPTFVLEEERFNREKHTRKFPFHSLKAAFDDRGLSLAGIDVITTPWHMRSLWRMMFAAVREGFPASLNLVPPSARPTQSTLIVTMPNGLRWGLLWHFGVKQRLPKIVQVRHHDAHAATFFVSPFEEATILVMDGYGDETAQSAYTGAGNRVERVAQSHIFNSLGMLYTAVTEHLGFKYFEEGTVMALAATGDKTYAKKFRRARSLQPRTENSPSTATLSVTTRTVSTGPSHSDLSRPLVRNARRTSRLATDIAISRSRSSTQLRKPSFTSFARCRNGTRAAISACSAVSR